MPNASNEAMDQANLEAALHAHWAADAQLAAHLPPERVRTGRGHGRALPHAAVYRERTRPRLRASGETRIDETQLRIDLYFAEHDAGRAAADALRRAFDRATLPHPAGTEVLLVRAGEETVDQDAEGIWRFALRLQVWVERV